MAGSPPYYVLHIAYPRLAVFDASVTSFAPLPVDFMQQASIASTIQT